MNIYIIIKLILNFLIYSNIWIAAAALAMTWQTCLLLNHTFEISLYSVFVFLATLLLYSIHRLVTLQRASHLPNEARFVATLQLKEILYIITTLSGISVIYLFFNFHNWLKISLFVPILLSAGYALPILPGRKRLRDISYLKNLLIASVWTWVTVWLPAMQMGRVGGSALFWMCVARFGFIFALSLAFDLRDIAFDRAAGVRTIPVAFGTSFTKKLAIGLNGLALLSAGVNTVSGFYSLGDFWGIGTALLLCSLLIANASPERGDWYFAGVLDGVMILQFLLIWW